MFSTFLIPFSFHLLTTLLIWLISLPQLVVQMTYRLFIPQPQMKMQHWPLVITNLKVQISLIALPSFLLANMSLLNQNQTTKII